MKNARPQTSEASALDKRNDTCTNCAVPEIANRLIDALNIAALLISAAILHGKREPFAGPPVNDAVRDAIEIRSQIIKAMSRGQS